MAAYNGRHPFWMSFIDLLLIFHIWMCHFDSVVSLGAESDTQATMHENFRFNSLMSPGKMLTLKTFFPV